MANRRECRTGARKRLGTRRVATSTRARGRAPSVNGKSVVGAIEAPNGTNRVYYGEMEYQDDGMTSYLSTQMQVLEKK
jgi:hypothetical protein